jgi:enoyl-CoA hydratase
MTTTAEATAVVLQERRGNVLVMRLNRPEQKNAVNLEIAEQMAAALDLLDSDPDLAVGVLTGGQEIFSAGMDLKDFARGQLPSLPGRGFGSITRATVRKPMIAAVEGWALGGGFEMALACDLIVAAENARFGFPEVTRGIVAGEGGLIRLPHRLPYHVAAAILLTGQPLSAADAARFGLVNVLTAPGWALEAALELAARIGKNAPLALAAVKQVIRDSQGLNDAAAFERQEQVTGPLLKSQDAHEGAVAFAEKRAPVWHGR